MSLSKGSDPGLRVLFLHELDSAPGSEKQRLLEKAAALLALTYWLGGKGATHYMWLKAVRIAEKKFKEQRTNVIVGTSFGAVVALSMDVPKVPMLLLSPAHEQYSRFMRLKNAFTLHAIPYVLIVHGSNDKTVPLDDSIRLLETADGPGRSRLEVINDTHGLKSIKPEELRQWVDEVYTQGKLQVKMLADSGSKDVDASLFSWDEPELAVPAQKEEGIGDREEQESTKASSSSTPAAEPARPVNVSKCSSSISSLQLQQQQQQQRETLMFAYSPAAGSRRLAKYPHFFSVSI
ncbi:hypothetical protein Emag_000561 [Eimeria magna]